MFEFFYEKRSLKIRILQKRIRVIAYNWMDKRGHGSTLQKRGPFRPL
jgi:hypothetical protein